MMTSDIAAPDLPPNPEWTDDIQRDFIASQRNGCVGQELLSESDRARVWTIRLAPGERVGFHRHVLDYFWTALTDGKSRSHFHDGRTVETQYRAGDTKHYTFGKGEFMLHDLTNIGDSEIAFTTVEFLDSANERQPIPDSVRR